MASVTTSSVAPGVSACFMIDEKGCHLHSLGETGTLFGERQLPIPLELRERTWATCEEAIEAVRGFYTSR